MRRSSASNRCLAVLLATGLVIVSGCAAHRPQSVGPTPISQAKVEIPEEELLDVGIMVFETGELDDRQAKKQGTNAEIRQSESHFIPFHLKNTMQLASHWGAVRVIPKDSAAADLLVKGEIIESNGDHLTVKIEAIDATGRKWLAKTYEVRGEEALFEENAPGSKDTFQDLYNAMANDIAAFKAKLTPAEIKEIRRIAQLKFARDFAPDAFGDYLSTDARGINSLARLPAEDDPIMGRILELRERDNMYVDTLNGYYEGFYNEMWPAYENWRKNNMIERRALKKVKRDAFVRQISGALMLAAAIALDVGDARNTRALQNILILGGGKVIIDGLNISREAGIHSAAIEELSDSFGSEMQPVVLELQGKKVELTGSVEEQYARWRDLLRQIYFAETGFEPLPLNERVDTENESSETTVPH